MPREITIQEQRLIEPMKSARQPKIQKKPFLVESRYIGSRLAVFVNRGWHGQSRYETLEAANQAIEAMNRRDNVRDFCGKREAWFEYRVAGQATTSEAQTGSPRSDTSTSPCG